MHTITLIIIALIIGIVVAVFIKALRTPEYRPYGFIDDDETEIETVIHHHYAPEPEPEIEYNGDIQVRVRDDGKTYVVDPADGKEWPVDKGDDSYEDAKNRCWRLRW